MKKRFTIVTAVLLIIATVFSVVACSRSADCVSELRDSIYKTEAGGLQATAYGGKRETSYALDGKCSATRDYFIVVLQGTYATEPVLKMTVNGSSYEKTATRHPFNEEYVFEIPVKVLDDTVKATVCIDGTDHELTFVSVKPANFPSSQSALQTAKNELQIGDFDGEIILRMIENPTKADGTYFWYVAFCKSEHEVKSVLINAEGVVVAKKAN